VADTYRQAASLDGVLIQNVDRIAMVHELSPIFHWTHSSLKYDLSAIRRVVAAGNLPARSVRA